MIKEEINMPIEQMSSLPKSFFFGLNSQLLNFVLQSILEQVLLDILLWFTITAIITCVLNDVQQCHKHKLYSTSVKLHSLFPQMAQCLCSICEFAFFFLLWVQSWRRMEAEVEYFTEPW